MVDHRPSPSHPASAAGRQSVGCASALDAWLGNMASQIMARPASPSFAAHGRSRTLMLPLVYDTSTPSLPSGIRAVVHDDSRHLLFGDDDFEVILRVRLDQQTGCSRLVGQVLYEGLPLAGVPMRLRHQDAVVPLLSDRAGGFHLPSLAAGSYDLQISAGGCLVTVPSILLGSRSDTSTDFERTPPSCARS